MILLDTSVWIEYLRQNRDYVDEVNLLLNSQFITTFEPVFAELLYGARSDKDKKLLMAFWNVLPKIEKSENMLLEAADYANQKNFQNLGIGLFDALIIQAVVKHGLKLWTLDKKILRNIEEMYIYKLKTEY